MECVLKENEDLVRDFESDFMSRGRTRQTALTYSIVLRQFERFLADKHGSSVPLQAVVRRDLVDYLTSLRNRQLTYGSLQRHFIVLSVFYQHLIDEGILSESHVPFVRRKYLKVYKNGGETAIRRLLTVLEVKKLLASIINIRDQLIILMLAKTGIREKELVALDISSIDLEHDIITLKPTPKRSNRTVFIDPELKTLLKTYLKYNRSDARPDDPLFLSRYGTRLTGQAVLAMVKMQAARIQLHNPEIADPTKHIGVHNFRHFFTTVMWRNGTGLPREYIKWLRGDKLRKEAMDIYLHMDQEDIRRRYLEVVPQLLS
jgi:integrase/recombinase XerD